MWYHMIPQVELFWWNHQKNHWRVPKQQQMHVEYPENGTPCGSSIVGDVSRSPTPFSVKPRSGASGLAPAKTAPVL
jgi:hypothetical protein